jgi:hypothetical protein
MMHRNAAFLAFPLIVMVASLAGCESKLNLANFEMVKPGMTIEEVTAILGPGEKQTQGQASNVAAGMLQGLPGAGGKKVESNREFFTWKEDRVEIGITFDNGKVVDKVQRGL